MCLVRSTGYHMIGANAFIGLGEIITVLGCRKHLAHFLVVENFRTPFRQPLDDRLDHLGCQQLLQSYGHDGLRSGFRGGVESAGENTPPVLAFGGFPAGNATGTPITVVTGVRRGVLLSNPSRPRILGQPSVSGRVTLNAGFFSLPISIRSYFLALCLCTGKYFLPTFP